MVEETEAQVVERLEKYAKAVARKVLLKVDKGKDDFRRDDIAQSLLLAGWQVWKDTGDEGLAHARMGSRAKNELNKLVRELGRWQTLSDTGPPAGPTGQSSTADSHERYDAEWAEPGYRRISVGPEVRTSPLENMVVREYLEGLPEDERKIAECRAAEMTAEETVETTGLSRSTVQRKLRGMRKELQ
ncbi:MAG: sigma-70 family RNA polymerase sigma factor [Planctomycetes bacterium]|nr:sigma-70 family RNA polymerase sigma factor [Planctomycetota bacterium]